MNTTPTSRSAAIALAGSVIIVDQVTKMVTAGARCGAVICPMRNEQLMLGVPGGSPWALIAASFAGVAMWLIVTRSLHASGHVPAAVGALIAGGAIANLIDRLALGAVRDFVAGPFDTVFNVADLAVFAGVVWLIRIAVTTTVPTSRKEVNS